MAASVSTMIVWVQVLTIPQWSAMLYVLYMVSADSPVTVYSSVIVDDSSSIAQLSSAVPPAYVNCV